MSEKKIVFETEWFNIEEDSSFVKTPQEKPFYRMNKPDSVVIIAFTGDKNLVLLKHFRETYGTQILEFPAGSIDPGESPYVAAVREFYEETGYSCENLLHVGIGRVAADRVKSEVHIFFGTNAVRNNNHEQEKGIEVFLATSAEFKKLVLRGEFKQLATLGSLLFIKWKLDPDELRGF